MEVYTYSEARQKLALVLDQAELTGKVLIRRKDGSMFALVPEAVRKSPLDVPSIKADISTEQIVALVRKERGRNRIGAALRREAGKADLLVTTLDKLEDSVRKVQAESGKIVNRLATQAEGKHERSPLH